MLQVLAKGKGRTIEGVASTSFGKSLAWHWDSGSARALIAKGYWDFVVLQDPGPRDVPDREKLLGTLRSFDAEIRKVRAKPVVLATWGSAMLPEAQHALTEPIAGFREDGGAILRPHRR